MQYQKAPPSEGSKQADPRLNNAERERFWPGDGKDTDQFFFCARQNKIKKKRKEKKKLIYEV